MTTTPSNTYGIAPSGQLEDLAKQRAAMYHSLDENHPEAIADDLAQGAITDEQAAERLTVAEAQEVVRETVQTDPNQAARMMMVSIDPLLRKLPYEQRTATLLNLLVTYAAEQPAALQARGKFINAMTHEFRTRLQQFLPMLLDGQATR